MEKLLKWIKEKNIHFYLRIILVSALPVATAMALEPQSMTSWGALGGALVDFVSNPYLVGLYLITLYQTFKTSKKEVE